MDQALEDIFEILDEAGCANYLSHNEFEKVMQAIICATNTTSEDWLAYFFQFQDNTFLPMAKR